MARLLLVCILAFVLGPAVLLAQNCTKDDYKASYTECTSDNTRDLVYYRKSDSHCTDGVPPPAPVYDLPCGITCPPGSHLPLGTKDCAPCPSGTFSIGGGYRFDSWYSWPSGVSFRRYNYFTNGTQHVHVTTGPQWTLEDTFIRSGNISNYQAAVLELSVYIASSVGHVSYSYRVNAEYIGSQNYDGIKFEVDGIEQMKLVSHTSNYVTVTYPLTFGAHVLAWSYVKDSSLSKGEDAAFIRMIEVAGINHADDFCTECLEGTYSPNSNSTSCLACPVNTHSNSTGASTCMACPPNEYSYSEADACTVREACTEDDYEQFYTSCFESTRNLNSTWITPVICNPNAPGATQLPPQVYGLPCGNCTDGTFRNVVTSACDYCADGHYSNKSTDGSCLSCPAGTAAVKSFAITQFDDWVVGSSTNCSGDCSNQGWLLHSSYMDSGIGHGSTVNSWFQFNISLVSAGVLIFDYSIICPSAQCSLSLSVDSGAPTVYSAPKADVQSLPIDLGAGMHSLNWTFSKYDYGTSRDDAARIKGIFVSNTVVGGAINCTKCPNGSISTINSKQCTPCNPGQESDASGTSCIPCTPGTFNAHPGGVCIPCGHGTTPFANRTGCEVNCTYSPEGSKRVYDFNALKVNNSYGPIPENKQNYYINVCSTKPQKCYSSATTLIDSYACQETPGKIDGSDVSMGKDIGHVLGWYSLPNNSASLYKTDLGVVMSLEYGDSGCAGTYGEPKARDTKVTLVCDPSAGIGAPVANGKLIEDPQKPCTYNFLWRSLYACPVCDPSIDIGYYFSSCQSNQRTKTYFWVKSPPLCHGLTLPEPVVVNCSETTTVCPPGQYLEEGTRCAPCKAGSYSVGGGERIMSWTKMPTRFTPSCTAAGSCTLWAGGQDGVETVSSGNGDSALTAVFDFVVSGSITFDYKLYSPNVGSFLFYIDGVEQLNLAPGISRLGWTNRLFYVPRGGHRFVWVFLGGSAANETTPRVGVTLQGVTIIGTDYHDDTCTPCPPGFKSAANASACTACGIDHYAPGADADTCLTCPAHTTALHKATACIPRLPCTESDFAELHTTCYANHTRTRYYEYLQPQTCEGGVALPPNEEVPCAACLPGYFQDPKDTSKCTVCAAGSYYDGSKCTAAPAGSVAVKKKYYFVDDSVNTLPQGFSTSCSGDCGSAGWRVLGASVDSGYHANNGVDSWLKYQVTVIRGFGRLSFDYAVAPGTAASVDLYMDGKYVTSLFESGKYSTPLAEGTHNVTWNYHQVQSTVGFVTVSNVVVEGVLDGDAGSYLATCPAGSFSEQGSANCTLCPPGSYAANASSEECTLCLPFTYSADYGATECLGCNAHTYSKPGSQYCSMDSCIFRATDLSVRAYNLSEVHTYGPLKAFGNSSFYFNFCNATFDSPCHSSKPTHTCAIEDGSTRRDWGGYLDFNSANGTIKSGSGNTSFEISFGYGDSDGCPVNTTRSSRFEFRCDVRVDGTPSFAADKSDKCTAVFVWTGRMGCPVCEDEDYQTMLGQCVDGMRTVERHRGTDCNGPDVVPAPSQSCSGTVEFPIAVVFIVIGVVLVLVAAAVVVFIKNRRITAQYSRLKHQSDHNIAMEHENDTL